MVGATGPNISGINIVPARDVQTEIGRNQTTFVSSRNQNTCFG